MSGQGALQLKQILLKGSISTSVEQLKFSNVLIYVLH